MAWITKSLVALGFVGAMVAATPTPTVAQGVYLGGPAGGVEIGRPGYRERHYPRSLVVVAVERGAVHACFTVPRLTRKRLATARMPTPLRPASLKPWRGFSPCPTVLGRAMSRRS